MTSALIYIGNLLWGLLLGSIFTLFGIITGAGTYISILRDQPIMVILMAITTLVCILMIGFSLKEFTFSSIAHLLGKYHVDEDQDSFKIQIRLLFFHSNTYKIPKVLSPRILRQNGRLTIICRDNYSQYYELVLGRFN